MNKAPLWYTLGIHKNKGVFILGGRGSSVETRQKNAETREIKKHDLNASDKLAQTASDVDWNNSALKDNKSYGASNGFASEYAREGISEYKDYLKSQKIVNNLTHNPKTKERITHDVDYGGSAKGFDSDNTTYSLGLHTKMFTDVNKALGAVYSGKQVINSVKVSKGSRSGLSDIDDNGVFHINLNNLSMPRTQKAMLERTKGKADYRKVLAVKHAKLVINRLYNGTPEQQNYINSVASAMSSKMSKTQAKTALIKGLGNVIYSYSKGGNLNASDFKNNGFVNAFVNYNGNYYKDSYFDLTSIEKALYKQDVKRDKKNKKK